MVDQVRPADLAAWFAAEPATAAPLVLDVREPWELAIASIQATGFEVRGIPMASVPAQLAALDPDQPVACLCHHGARSQRVASFLAQNGFGKVINIAGGIDAWSRELDPGVPHY